MEELVSIIIPVYNVEKYLDRCIRSVLSQSYKKIEIVLVDDGSTDSCPKMCDDYAKTDSRIIALHKKNGGLSDARNYGLLFAKGKYVTFIDSDDCVEETYIQYLLENLEQFNADISMCSFRKFITLSELKAQNEIAEGKLSVISGKEALERFCYHNIPHEAWAKLYRIELFQDIKFPKGKIYEDYGTVYKLFYNSKKVVLGDAKKYFYFQRENSIMNNTFSLKNMDRAELTEEFLNFIKEKSPELEGASYTRALISYSMLLRDCPNTAENMETRIEIANKIREYSKEVIKHKNNKFSIICMAILSNISISWLQILLRIIKKI